MKNKKVFIPLGFVFIGAGVVFISTLNRGVGLGLLALGTVYLILGLTGKKKK